MINTGQEMSLNQKKEMLLFLVSELVAGTCFDSDPYLSDCITD